MIQTQRIIVLLALLSTTFSVPAFARLVIGVTPAVTPGADDPVVVRALEDELSSRLGEVVQVRSFDSEATQLDWLIRFRELDAALVGRNLPGRLPAGTLLQLADLSSAVAVTHPGVAAAHSEKLGKAFRNLLEDERGRQLLSRLAGTAKVATRPKSEPVRRTAQPVAPAPAKPAALAPMESRAVAAKPTPALPTAKPAATTVPTSPTTPAIVPPAPPSAALPPAKAPVKQPVAAATPDKAQPTAPSPAATPPAEPASPKRTRLLLLAALVVLIGIGIKVTLLMRHWEQKRRTSHPSPEPPGAEAFEFLTSGEQAVTAPSLPLSPAAASAVAVGDNPRQSESRPAVPTMAEQVLARSREARATAPTLAGSAPDSTQANALRVNMAAKGKVNFDFRSPAPVAVAAQPAISPASQTEPAQKKRAAPRRKAVIADEVFPATGDDLIVEQGRLGKVKVPALLKRCADISQPVILRVRSGDNETCIHFAAGQICHAYSRNWRSDAGTRQWIKLGYLMVRDGLISETQRDQALEMIERQPELRFAAALQRLGAIELEALRHILARQAKTTVFALILFCSGEYRIEVDSGAIPAEESIALQVEALIREASHHQAEWTAIRKVLPNLGTSLDFAPDGREKLEQVRLSVHQQLLLSQVDGQTPIGMLCSDSTMMDYEVCRFLYLMVKAGVLQVMPSI